MTLPPCSTCTLECTIGVISTSPPAAGNLSADNPGTTASRVSANASVIILRMVLYARQRVDLELAGAGADLLDRNAHLVDDRDEQVRGRIAFVFEVTPALEQVGSSDQQDRQIVRIVRVAVAHAGAVH